MKKNFLKTFLQTVFVITALFLFDVSAADVQVEPAEALRLLREHLDSLEMEMQANKRLDKPTDELEAQAAVIRDSLLNMRETVVAHADLNESGDAQAEKKSVLDMLTSFIPKDILSFRPKGTFDWIIVGTGAAALLSIFMLIIGIAVSGKKKSKESKTSMPVGRKMNLALPAKQNKIIEDNPEETLSLLEAHKKLHAEEKTNNTENLQSLISHLRELAPEPPPPPPPPPITPPPVAKPQAVTPSAPPPPLFVSAPEISDEALKQASSATNVNDMILAAAQSGMNEQDISKRYHVSIDQVRLIMRMNKI